MAELRCSHKMHGILNDSGILDIKCDSAFCGHEPGVVVIHQFSTVTGELLGTKRYKAIPTSKQNGRRVANA